MKHYTDINIYHFPTTIIIGDVPRFNLIFICQIVIKFNINKVKITTLSQKTWETTILEKKIVLKLSKEGNSYSTATEIINKVNVG